MIITILIFAFFAIFVAFVLSIAFPDLLSSVSTYVDALVYYLSQGMDIVWLFVPKTFTLALMTLAISVEVIYLGYMLVMWIIRKIPVAGIK